MRKIISLFQRNYDGDRLVRDEFVPGTEWVVAGEGVATRKWDGTACMVESGFLYKRYDAKHGKIPPQGFIAAQEADAVTGHWPGWVLVSDKPEDKWFRLAWESLRSSLPDGTYELVGPKVQANSEGFDSLQFIRHGAEQLLDCPRTFGDLRQFLSQRKIEGIVWHHPDGRMVKIKRKDFGLPWPIATEASDEQA